MYNMCLPKNILSLSFYLFSQLADSPSLVVVRNCYLSKTRKTYCDMCAYFSQETAIIFARKKRPFFP